MFQVGDCVYQTFSPVQSGKIVEDLGPIEITRPDGSTYQSSFHRYRVKWLKDGSVTEANEFRLNDFSKLVEDHRRKYESQSQTLEKLKAL